ncbi:hypothetical protein IQ244_28725 [Nostoc sp. LEGE 06077]|uniref:hypothetical protein n=1 Tax=Nostoc sp. LEGE 06077 TaxID=915325 RepID=UPI00187E7CD2|nr:hypothetical protein [Nostoc sp. LEGE 06077]MBE9210418.1 hypothetical protein [Nostoc sp. LEGE 06077]
MTKPQTNKSTDPSWDFYITWHSCQYAKALIDKALATMNTEEFPNAELYPKAQTLVREAEGYLRELFR